MELSLDTLESVLGLREVEQMEDDSLVWSQELATGNSEDGGVGNVTSGTCNNDSLGLRVCR